MATHKSAKKANRKTITRTAINKSRTSRIRTFIKALETQVSKGDKQGAIEQLKVTQSEIMRGVTKGVIKKNTAARTVSRLSVKVKAIA